MYKKFLSLFLAAALILSCVPFSALAAEDTSVPEKAKLSLSAEDSAAADPVNYATSGTCGDNATWSLVNGVLTISGTGAMWDYREGYNDGYDVPAPWDKDSVTSIVVNNGITYLGEDTFSYCYSLTSVSLPNSVTTFGPYCFWDCDELVSITIPNSVTTLDYGCFATCNSLLTITIPASVTTLNGSCFYDCSTLVMITFRGNAPYIDDYAFEEVSAYAYYPPNNSTWTSSVMQNYSGDITWVPSGTTPMYRLYNQYTNEHLFLTSSEERLSLINAGWTDEGIGWTASTAGDPVYRLYNPYGNFHFYSKNWNEVVYLVSLGWTLDGPVSFDAGETGVPIYRLFNPYETTNYHHYTTSQEEAAWLQSLGWNLEGVAWYAAN